MHTSVKGVVMGCLPDGKSIVQAVDHGSGIEVVVVSREEYLYWVDVMDYEWITDEEQSPNFQKAA